mmetsp:Transcript_33943/g.104204  ORF Transcript_33943/g.104204 Transcript_33943/m.104204 type:complete len:265 (+) Transcript_33943:75-869(+)
MYRGVLGALEREGDGRGERERGENARRGAVGALLAERVLADFCRLVHFAVVIFFVVRTPIPGIDGVPRRRDDDGVARERDALAQVPADLVRSCPLLWRGNEGGANSPNPRESIERASSPRETPPSVLVPSVGLRLTGVPPLQNALAEKRAVGHESWADLVERLVVSRDAEDRGPAPGIPAAMVGAPDDSSTRSTCAALGTSPQQPHVSPPLGAPTATCDPAALSATARPNLEYLSALSCSMSPQLQSVGSSWLVGTQTLTSGPV